MLFKVRAQHSSSKAHRHTVTTTQVTLKHATSQACCSGLTPLTINDAQVVLPWAESEFNSLAYTAQIQAATQIGDVANELLEVQVPGLLNIVNLFSTSLGAQMLCLQTCWWSLEAASLPVANV